MLKSYKHSFSGLEKRQLRILVLLKVDNVKHEIRHYGPKYCPIFVKRNWDDVGKPNCFGDDVIQSRVIVRND